MRGVAKVSLVLIAGFLSACATPHVTLHRTQSFDLGPLTSLPNVTLEFSETITRPNENSDQRVHKFSIARVVADSDRVFAIEPERLQWRETRLAPTYFDDTTVIRTLGVETIDRRVAFARAVVSTAGALGVDLTVLDGAEPQPCSHRATSDQVQGWLTHSPAPSEAAPIRIGTAPCAIQLVSIGPISPGAIALDDVPLGRTIGAVPYAACVQLEFLLTNTQGGPPDQRLRVSVPDARFARMAQLPYKGTLNFATLCSAANTTNASGPEQSDLQVLSDILAEFSDDDE